MAAPAGIALTQARPTAQPQQVLRHTAVANCTPLSHRELVYCRNGMRLTAYSAATMLPDGLANYDACTAAHHSCALSAVQRCPALQTPACSSCASAAAQRQTCVSAGTLQLLVMPGAPQPALVASACCAVLCCCREVLLMVGTGAAISHYPVFETSKKCLTRF